MRYFFHTADGSRERDEDGTELPDHAAARREAIRYAGECMALDPDILATHLDFRVEVTDGKDRLLFTIVALAIDAPAAEARG